jgi:hypothetical protein
MRSLWFNDNFEPFEEKSSEEIENKHIELYKDLLLKSMELENSLNMNNEMESFKFNSEQSSPLDNRNEAPKALIERNKIKK